MESAKLVTFWDDGVIQLRFHPNRKFPSNFVRWPLKAERGCSAGNFWKILMVAAKTLIGFSFPPKKAEKVEHRQIKRHDVYRTGHQLKCQFVRRCVRYTPAKKWSARLMISEKMPPLIYLFIVNETCSLALNLTRVGHGDLLSVYCSYLANKSRSG